MPVRPMSGVIFSAIDQADGDKTGRSDSPDSGQGGYFTQSESESRGSQSPVEAQTKQIYKLANNFGGSQSKIDNRRTKSTLQSYQDVSAANRASRSQELRSGGKGVTSSHTGSKVANNRSKLPPRPPRVSSSLPPPVPPLPRKQADRRTVSSSKRQVLPPPQDRKPLGKTLPLQVQSPSIVAALQATRRPSTSPAALQATRRPSTSPAALQSTRRPSTSPAAPTRRGVRSVCEVAGKSQSPGPVSRPSQKTRDVNCSPSKELIKPTKPAKTSVKITRDSVKSRDKVLDNKSKIPSESLAVRAKRTTEDKVKQICRNLKSSSQERRKGGQKEEMMMEKTNLDRNDSCQFPKQPVQSLIKLYDKSKVKCGQFNKPANLNSVHGNQDIKPKQKIPPAPKSSRSHNCVSGAVVSGNKRDGNTFGQHVVKSNPGSGRRPANESSKYSSHNRTPLTAPRASRAKQGTTSSSSSSSAKANSIDEFLESAKRTRQKYQDMLKDDGDKRSDKADSLEVKTEPTERDLQTGCFTDVSFAGYFANTKTAENSHGMNMNNISIYGNSVDLDENQNNLCNKQPSGDQEAEMKTDDPEAREHPDNKNINQDFVPTPSPRNKKRQRREQILQEHKQLGNKIVLALAKTNFETEQNKEISDQAAEAEPDNCCVTDQARHLSEAQPVQNVGDNDLQLKLRKLEKQIRALEDRSEQLECEKQMAVRELEETQLMSEDQIEKLCTLERKQDFLEVENTEIRQKLQRREAEFYNLNQQFSDLQKEREILNAKYTSLVDGHNTLEVRQNDAQEISALDEKIDTLQSRITNLETEKKHLVEVLENKQSNFYGDIEKIKVAYELEMEKLEGEMEKLKTEVVTINEKNDILDLEKRHLEDKLNKLHQLDYDEIIDQLRLDLKQTKALLKDSQSEKNSEAGNAKIIKQLKVQLEEAESEKNASVRQRKSFELDLLELQEQMEDISEEKRIVEKKYEDAKRENLLLTNQLKENEEELEEILNKYKSSISALTAHQNSLQSQATIIAELENENLNLFDKIEALQRKCSHLQEDSQLGNDKKSELKLKELEHKLNLEISSRERFESLNERLKDKISQCEAEATFNKKNFDGQEDLNKKLNIQIKDLKEDIVTLQIREMDVNEKKNILEKKLEIAEAETITVRSHLELANRRIEDLQLALNCDTESECSSLPYSDHCQDDLDIFLMNHRKRMAEQKEEERKIRESLLTTPESDC